MIAQQDKHWKSQAGSVQRTAKEPQTHAGVSVSISSWAPPVLLFVGTLALYLLTRTHRNTFDAVSYAGLIAIHKDAPGASAGWMFHPHHLLFNAMGYLCWKLAQLAGYRGGPLVVLQDINALLGAAGVALFYLIARRILAPRAGLALLAALGVALSFGYWICATDGRVNMASLVCLLAAFFALVRYLEAPSARLAGWLGLAGGVAVLFHESAGLFGLVGLIGVLHARTPRKATMAYLAAYIATIAVPYLIVGCFVEGLRSPAALRHWMNSYAELGWWWDFRLLRDLKQDLFAARHALFVEPPGSGTLHLAHSVPLALRAAYYTALAGWVAACLFLVFGVPRLLRNTRRRPLALLCSLWAILYAAFFTVWSPGYFVFWVPALPPLSLLLLMEISSLPKPRRGTVTATLSAWLILLWGINAACAIRPGLAAGASRFEEIATNIRAHTAPRDLVIVAGAGDNAQCEVDIPYYAQRNLLSLHSTLTSAHEDLPLALQTAQARIAHTLGLGHHVFALDEVLHGQRALAALHARHPEFTAADLQALTSLYQWKPAWIGPSGTVWEALSKITPTASSSPGRSLSSGSRRPGAFRSVGRSQ